MESVCMRGRHRWIWLAIGLLLLNPLSTQARPSKKKKKPPQSKQDKRKRKLVRKVRGKGLLRVLRLKRINRSLHRMLRSLRRTPRLSGVRQREGLKRRYRLRTLDPREVPVSGRVPRGLKPLAAGIRRPRVLMKMRNWMQCWGMRLVVYRRKWTRKHWEKRWLGHILLKQPDKRVIPGRIDGVSAEGKRLLLSAAKEFQYRSGRQKTLSIRRFSWQLRRYLERTHHWEVVQQTIHRQPPSWKQLPAFSLTVRAQR